MWIAYPREEVTRRAVRNSRAAHFVSAQAATINAARSTRRPPASTRPDPKEPPESEPEPEEDEHGAALARTFREIEKDQEKEA